MSISPIGGGTPISRGAWNGLSAYNPLDCVTDSGVGYMNYVGVPAPAAGNPTLDTHASHLNAANTSSISATLTTGGAGLICAVVQICQDGGGATTVASVADTATLTWTKRSQFAPGGTFSDIELWTAPASGALVADVITATFAGAAGGNNSATMVVFALDNYNTSTPFDGHAGLPFNGTGTTPLSVSTTYALDLGLFVGVNANSGPAITAPTGYTTISNTTNTAGLRNTTLIVAYQEQSAPMSGVSVGLGGGDASNLQVFDAIQGSAVTPNTAPGSDPSHWVG
jgi:hypothetical protein